jgi:hypothetical protein
MEEGLGEGVGRGIICSTAQHMGAAVIRLLQHST